MSPYKHKKEPSRDELMRQIATLVNAQGWSEESMNNLMDEFILEENRLYQWVAFLKRKAAQENGED